MSLNLPDPNQPLPQHPVSSPIGPTSNAGPPPPAPAVTPPRFPDGSQGAVFRTPYAIKRRNGWIIAVIVSGPILFVLIIGITVAWMNSQF